MPLPSQRLAAVAATALLAVLPGCMPVGAFVAMPFLYEEASLPEERVLLDLPYRQGRDADPRKHRLDLFLPTPTPGVAGGGGWPVLVFVHGGGWTSGDRSLTVAGADVYRNIGRWFAARGVGVAVISYRLQFDATIDDQVEDVARAVDWVRGHVAAYGGDPDALFVSGHSAGAQLAARLALDPALAAGEVCGLIPVSGAGYDLADERTYELGADRGYYERRFRNGDAGDDWPRTRSATSTLGPEAPPTLVLYAEDDWPSLVRQAELLDARLRAAGVESRLVQVPDEDHYTVVLALSRDDKVAAPAILAFIRDTRC